MNILHVSHHYKPCKGGMEKVIEELSKNLNEKGHSNTVLCLNKCHGGKKLASRENYPEARVERISFTDLKYYKIAPFGLGKMAKADVIHVHGLGFFSDFLALTKLLHGKPLVLSTHGGIFHTENISALKKLYFFLSTRLVLKAFDKIIAVSKQDFEIFNKIVPAEKIVVIENGVDVDKLGKFKGDASKNNFLFVGRLSKNKGLTDLLETFSIVKKKTKTKFTLKIVGGEFDLQKAELEKKAAEIGIKENVELLGQVNENKLMNAYHESGVFVSASHYEGFGISAIEAMATGLIPVLNRIPTFSDFVNKGGGVLVDFADTKNTADAILKLMEMGRTERIGLAKKTTAFARGFSWEEKTKEHVSVYKGCLK